MAIPDKPIEAFLAAVQKHHNETWTETKLAEAKSEAKRICEPLLRPPEESEPLLTGAVTTNVQALAQINEAIESLEELGKKFKPAGADLERYNKVQQRLYELSQGFEPKGRGRPKKQELRHAIRVASELCRRFSLPHSRRRPAIDLVSAVTPTDKDIDLQKSSERNTLERLRIAWHYLTLPTLEAGATMMGVDVRLVPKEAGRSDPEKT
jgi:DNA repair ATPase RecN